MLFSQSRFRIRPFKILCSFFVLVTYISCLSLGNIFAAHTYAPPIQQAEPVVAVPDALSKMLLIEHRNRQNLNQIFEFDKKPLGTRLPVIMVPGRAEEFVQNAWWKTLHEMCLQNDEFNRRFKLYIYMYDSKNELDVQATEFSEELRKRFGHL